MSNALPDWQNGLFILAMASGWILGLLFANLAQTNTPAKPRIAKTIPKYIQIILLALNFWCFYCAFALTGCTIHSKNRKIKFFWIIFCHIVKKFALFALKQYIISTYTSNPKVIGAILCMLLVDKKLLCELFSFCISAWQIGLRMVYYPYPVL